jgi:NAD(P)H-hydrate epimerase
MTSLTLDRERARLVDRLAIDEFGMTGLVLMENAGRGCVDQLVALGIQGPVVICCGRGNNAGDGFVIARHLDLRSYTVKVVLCCDPDQLGGDARCNYLILQKSDVPIVVVSGDGVAERVAKELAQADWVVDALLGTGARGEPRHPLDQVIRAMNEANAKKLAVDLPSGLDCDSGQPATHTFRADHTCTFVAIKQGMTQPSAVSFVGEIHVLDIGAPGKLIERIAQIG